jgi:hypothetical protein
MFLPSRLFDRDPKAINTPFNEENRMKAVNRRTFEMLKRILAFVSTHLQLFEKGSRTASSRPALKPT